ncbi:MAG: gliding motility-associated protein GldE [Adhaeribacter sp.]|nr:gliding motility-associated protein GldE [Adhaeribacter sp.]
MENINGGEPPGNYIYLVSALFSSFSLDYALEAVGIILLLLLSALVSGAETAFFSLSEAELATCRQHPQRSYQRILLLLQHPRRLLTSMLVIDNIINVALVMIILNLTLQLSGPHLSFPLVLTIAVGLTIIISFFGEVLPKIRATQNRLTTASRMAGFLHLADKILAPISVLLLGISAMIERNVRAKSGSVQLDELQNAIDATLTTENQEEKEILKGIVNFSTTTVKQVMRSRVDVIAFEITTSFTDLLPLINQWGYSRVPVYADTVDKIEGILYIKDLLQHLDAGPDFSWQGMLRPPYFVPESKKIDDLLREFQEMHVHMAIVVDEYGGTAGLLTFEDIVEEIVGEINDEFDEEAEV